jgi:hypothetical protein
LPYTVKFSSEAIISQFIPIIYAKVLGLKMSEMIESDLLNVWDGKMGRVVNVNNAF